MWRIRVYVAAVVLATAVAPLPTLHHPPQAQAAEGVRVITPHGGEQWVAGRQYFVGWSTLGVHSTSFAHKPKVEFVDETGSVLQEVTTAESFAGVDDDDFGRARVMVPLSLLGKRFTVRVSVFDDQVPGVVAGSSAGPVTVVGSVAERACANQQLVQATALFSREFANLGLDTSSHPNILRYRVRWPTGEWLGWFTPGLDDVDWRWNNDGTKRRLWSYFGDYPHEYVACYDQGRPVEKLTAPSAGAYAFEVNWFRSPGVTYFFNSREELKPAEAAAAGATTLKLTGAVSLNRTYLIYNRERKAVELINPDVNSLSGIHITLQKPLQYYYGSDDGSRLVPLLGAYGGYCPVSAGPTAIGYLDLGSEITLGHITVLPTGVIGPVLSADPDYYSVEQVGPNRFTVRVDDGRHEAWRARGEPASYASAQLAVYLTPQLVAERRLALSQGSLVSTATCGGVAPAASTAVPAATPVTDSDFASSLRERGYTLNSADRALSASEAAKVTKAEAKTIQRLAGKFATVVPGVPWYVDGVSSIRALVRDGAAAYALMQAVGRELTTAELNKIPVGLIQTVRGPDSDGDRLDDPLEKALGTNPTSRDSDGDKVADRTEILRGTNPLGRGRLVFDSAFARKLNGTFVIQDGNLVWYVSAGKRYFVRDATAAGRLIRTISLAVSARELVKVPVLVLE